MTTSRREWFGAAELAGLPGMPGTKRSVLRRGPSAGWTSREVPCKGGPRIEYHIASLPAETRAALAAREIGAVLSTSEPAKNGAAEGAKLGLRETLDARGAERRRLEALKQSASLVEQARARMDAKLQLLHAREVFRRRAGLSLKASEFAFAEAYNRGEIDIAESVRRLIPRIGGPTLQRWRKLVATQGITALAGDYGNRRGDGKIDRQPALRDFVIGMLVRTPNVRATQVMKGIRARFADGAVLPPSMRSLERWLKDWRAENAQTLTALANPDLWKNKYMVAFGSASAGIARLNQRWELDSTPADVMLTDGRHTVLGAIDVFTRRPKLLVSKTSRAVAVASLLRRALLDWGVPEAVKTDNGSDYVSNHVTRVLRSLEIEQELCPPFQPWHKPHIERFFGTFTRDLVELLEGFIGHSVAERQAIEARRSFADRLMKRGDAVEISMSAAEFQKFCDDWIDNVYMHQPHEALEGRTPFETVAAWRHPVRRIDDERALDILLAEAPGNNGMRTVQKKGIQLDEAWFIAPELEAYVGQLVQVLLLPDLGRVVVKGGPDLQFVCIAECPERTGMDRREVAIRAREIQKRRVQEERRALRATARTVRTDDVVNEILLERGLAAKKVALLPQPAEPHMAAGLAAAIDAAAELDRPARTTAELITPEFLAAKRRIEAEQITAGADNELAQHRGIEPQEFNSVAERVHWLLRASRFRALTTEEQDTLAQFRRGQPASYRRMVELVDEQFAGQKRQDPAAAGS